MKFDKKKLKQLAPDGGCLGKKIKAARSAEEVRQMRKQRDADRKACRKRINRLIDKQLEEDGDI